MVYSKENLFSKVQEGVKHFPGGRDLEGGPTFSRWLGK